MTQNYTPEFRKKIVRLHEEEGQTYKSIVVVSYSIRLCYAMYIMGSAVPFY